MSEARAMISMEGESAAARYERSLDAGARRRAGVYFTPGRLVELVRVFAGRSAGDRVLDPSCGAGGFPAGAARALAARGGRRGRKGELWGFEIDREAAALARGEVAKVGQRYRCEIRGGDFFDIE